MKATIESKLDVSVLNAMRAWRRQTETRAEEKLALLRRLRRQFETGSLPKLTETQVEQSFNEQILARVFGYDTLFSGNGEGARIQAKPFIQATRSFPDFAIGRFDAGSGVIIAAAELKNPEVKLYKKQDRSYDYLTPVQQAFDAVKGQSSCKWILVSNYRELRLYERVDLKHKRAPTRPYLLVKAQLCDIRNRNDLAELCAHFDYRALVGPWHSTTGESELMAARRKHHPAKPIEKKDDHVRLVLLFTPRVEEDFPMFRLEHRLRDALTNRTQTSVLLASLARSSAPKFELAEGCISVTVGENLKLSLSGLGQLQISVLQEAKDKKIGTNWLVDMTKLFVTLVDDLYHTLSEAARPGRVSPELRDVKDVVLEVEQAHHKDTMSREGTAATTNVMGVDFVYTPVLDKGNQLIVDLVSELAIYFRGADGGVGIDRDALLKRVMEPASASASASA